VTPTVQDLHDLLFTLETDDDDERARILRRAERATVHPGVSPTTELAAALVGQELGPVLSREAVSHVRSWLKARAIEKTTPAPVMQLVPPAPPRMLSPYLPPRGDDRPRRKLRW